MASPTTGRRRAGAADPTQHHGHGDAQGIHRQGDAQRRDGAWDRAGRVADFPSVACGRSRRTRKTAGRPHPPDVCIYTDIESRRVARALGGDRRLTNTTATIDRVSDGLLYPGVVHRGQCLPPATAVRLRGPHIKPTVNAIAAHDAVLPTTKLALSIPKKSAAASAIHIGAPRPGSARPARADRITYGRPPPRPLPARATTQNRRVRGEAGSRFRHQIMDPSPFSTASSPSRRRSSSEYRVGLVGVSCLDRLRHPACR